MRNAVAHGQDPKAGKKVSKIDTAFRVVALQWWEKFKASHNELYAAEVLRRLEREVFPFIGNEQLADLTAPKILAVALRIEKRGTIETAHKIKSFISQVLNFAIASGMLFYNPARDLGGALTPRRKKPRPAIIDPLGAGKLMLAIDAYSRGMVRCALLLQALTFVRPGELRQAEWAEFNLDAAEWRIPAEKMKMKRPHIVPLSSQALTVLETLKNYSAGSKYLFPSTRTLDKPMSDNTVNAALRYLGYHREEMCGHGFRAMASSLLSEQGWSVDAIECQLAHVEGNSVRAAYHRSAHLDERRKMMQAWAGFLDELRERSQKTLN